MDTFFPASPVPLHVYLKRHILLIAVLTGFTSPAIALEWEIKNLGVLPGAISSFGTALNDHGQVAGNLDFGTFTETDGDVFNIQFSFLSGPDGGPLSLIPPLGYTNFKAHEVNNSGQVIGEAVIGSATNVGWVTGANGQGLQETVLFHKGVDINDSGGAVFWHEAGGMTVTASGETIFSDRTLNDPRGINNAGEVILPFSYEENGIPRSTGGIWSESAGLQPIFFQGARTALFDINNTGQVLGWASGYDLLVLNPGDGSFTSIDLPGTLLSNYYPPGSVRFNDAGQIVGKYELDGTTFSFLASSTTAEVVNLSMEEDILAAGWSNILVNDINNLGQITGTGTINGTTRAFLLTPVPEPETYAMMLAGLSILGFARRRKMKQP